MPSTTTRMARGQSRSVMMAPRSPARRRTVSSKRRACVLSMFSHIAGNEAKHKSVFHGTEPHPNCWTSVSGMQSETAIWHIIRLWLTIPLTTHSRTARPRAGRRGRCRHCTRSIQAVATLPTMPLPKNASPSAATLAAITVPAQAAPTRLPKTIRWSWWNPVGL